ncbi:MAG: flavin reductase [Thermoplasmata archaeon]|nr:MAG: flavin reductase [Thermoplasmata archaeon]
MVDEQLALETIHKVRNGVSVVTSFRGDEINGLTVAWASQVSYSPPMVMISVGPGRHTHDMIKESGCFAINILGESKMELAKHFGMQSGRKVKKFENIEYERKVTGAPILIDAIAYLDCKVHSSHTAGDHTIFVGTIEDCKICSDEEPLIYRTTDYWG